LRKYTTGAEIIQVMIRRAKNIKKSPSQRGVVTALRTLNKNLPRIRAPIKQDPSSNAQHRIKTKNPQVGCVISVCAASSFTMHYIPFQALFNPLLPRFLGIKASLLYHRFFWVKPIYFVTFSAGFFKSSFRFVSSPIQPLP
jgi:hypothetical protein